MSTTEPFHVQPGDVIIGRDWRPAICEDEQVLDTFTAHAVISREKSERFWELLRARTEDFRTAIRALRHTRRANRVDELMAQFDAFAAQDNFGPEAAPNIQALRMMVKLMLANTAAESELRWLGSAMFHRDFDNVTLFE